MGLFGSGRPNVKRLARKGELAGLRRAVSYRDEQVGFDGTSRDVGAPIRAEALAALSGLGGRHFADAVAVGLVDENPAVRVAAVYAGAQSHLSQITDALIAGVASWPDPLHGTARTAAAETLSAWRPALLPERFALALTIATEQPVAKERDGDLLEKFAANDARGIESALESTASGLVDRVVDTAFPEVVRERAGEVLLWLGAQGTVPLERALSGRDPDLRVVRLGGDLRDNVLLEPLVLLCDHRDPSRRSAAAVSVGKIQDTRGVSALLRLSQDESHAVRKAALEALDNFGVSGVVFGLAAGARQPMLTDANGGERPQQRAIGGPRFVERGGDSRGSPD